MVADGGGAGAAGAGTAGAAGALSSAGKLGVAGKLGAAGARSTAEAADETALGADPVAKCGCGAKRGGIATGGCIGAGAGGPWAARLAFCEKSAEMGGRSNRVLGT